MKSLSLNEQQFPKLAASLSHFWQCRLLLLPLSCLMHFLPSCGEEEVNIAHTPRCEHAMLHSMFGTFGGRETRLARKSDGHSGSFWGTSI